MKRAPDAKMTCNAIWKVIRNQGRPEFFQSDNGPPFQSKEMRSFVEEMGYDHVHITPEWPKSNGMVERFNRSTKEAVQAGCLEG